MNAVEPSALLQTDDRPPVEVRMACGGSPFLLIADHAGNRVPRRLATLGLDAAQLEGHIAWDIGAGALARELGSRLNATTILQTYSRLVVDCNRPLDAADSIARISDGIPIPGNRDVSRAERAARISEIFEPYHRRIAAELDARQAASAPCVLIALHSFTPRMDGIARPWHCGVLYSRDSRFAQALLRVLREDAALCVGDNQPYAAGDDTDYAIPRHGEARGLLHAGVEIRQDLLHSAQGRRAWAERLAQLLPRALQSASRGALDAAASNLRPRSA